MSQTEKNNSEVCDHAAEFRLVRSDFTWRRQTADRVDTAAQVSDARIYESSTAHTTTWTVVSPIVFTYKVIQCEKLLDADNDVLLHGHVSDSEEVLDHKDPNKKLKRFTVMDETVHSLYGARVAAYFQERKVTYKILPLPTTEENKTMLLVTRILEELHEFGVDRRTEPIIAIGGGVCLDVVGLAASLYRRRTPYIRVPTTLLAYIDASVGAKNGVNFVNCKNKLGSYVPPVATLLDRTFLCSLPRRHLSNGMAEMLKMALMKHERLFAVLLEQGRHLLDSNFQTLGRSGEDELDAASVSTTAAITSMLEELAPNLWEDDLDRLVDFGHVISPQLEMKVLPALLHGEAVNIDMALMVYVAEEKGLLSSEEKSRVMECMRRLELPLWHSSCTLGLIHTSLTERLQHCGGQLRIPLPTGLGRAEIVNDIEEITISRAFTKWCDEQRRP